MAAESAETVIIKIEDMASGPADRASSALARLENQIVREGNALARLESQMTSTKAKMTELKAAGDAAGVDKQRIAIGALTDKIGAQRDKIAALKERAADSGKALKAMGEGAQVAGAQLGVTTSSAGQLLATLTKLGPEGAAVAAVMLALGSAVVAMAAVFARAVSASGELRDEQNKLRASTIYSLSVFGAGWLYNGMRASTAQAEQLQEALTRVAASSSNALSRSQLADYVVQIRQAGFQGKQLETVLSAMSTAATGGTKEMATQFLAAAKSARMFGLDVNVLADRVQKKLGGNARAAAASLDVQMRKLGENMTWIFGGADIGPLLTGLQAVLSVFDANSESAKSLRDMVTSFTEAAIGGILDLATALVDAYIWLRSHKVAWDVLVATVKAMAVVMGVVVALIGGALVVAATNAVAPFLLLAAAMGAVYIAIERVSDWAKEAVPRFFASFGELARAIPDAFVSMIKGGAGRVIAAVESLSGDVVGAFRRALGIHSPSAVIEAQVAQPTIEPLANLHRRAPEVRRSAAATADALVDGASSGVGRGGASGGRSIVFDGCTFNGTQTEEDVRRMLVACLEDASYEAAMPAIP